MKKRFLTLAIALVLVFVSISSASAAKPDKPGKPIEVTPMLEYYRVFDHYEGEYTVTDYEKYYMGSVMMSNYSYTTTGYLYYEQSVAISFTHSLNITVDASASFKAVVAEVALSPSIGGAYSRSYNVNYTFGGGVDVEPRTRQVLEAYNPGAHVRGIKVYEIVEIDGSHLDWEEEIYNGNWYPTTTSHLVILTPTSL